MNIRTTCLPLAVAGLESGAMYVMFTPGEWSPTPEMKGPAKQSVLRGKSRTVEVWLGGLSATIGTNIDNKQQERPCHKHERNRTDFSTQTRHDTLPKSRVNDATAPLTMYWNHILLRLACFMV